MQHSKARPRFASALAMIAIPVMLSVTATAQPLNFPTSAAGKGIDFSNPLDGVADQVTPSTSTIDLEFNEFDAEPSAVREDRAIFEFDLSNFLGDIESAFLEFETFGENPVGVINVYTYDGNSSLDLADFSQIATLITQPDIGAAGVYSIDVTSALVSPLHSPGATVGFIIAMSTEDQLMSIWNVGEMGHLDPRLVVNGPCAGDANHDGIVTFADVTEVLGNWLAVCP